MRLLITRPREDAERTADALRALGHEPIIAPMLEVRLHAGAPVSLDGVQAVLATSSNGLKALIARCERRDVTVYAVGPQTAEVARAAGFHTVRNAGRDGNALASLLISRGSPIYGTLLHPSGEEIAGHMQETLEANGFIVDRKILYGVEVASDLPEAAAGALRDGSLDGALIFSPRSGRVFADLVTKAGLASACERLTAFCISSAAAAALSPLMFRQVAIAESPNQQAMLELIPPQQS